MSRRKKCLRKKCLEEEMSLGIIVLGKNVVGKNVIRKKHQSTVMSNNDAQMYSIRLHKSINEIKFNNI